MKKYFYLTLFTTFFQFSLFAQQVWNFNYTGNQQSITLQPGNYQLEVWGAQGGSNYGIGGKGGYSKAEITIISQQVLYVFVGGQGASDIRSNSIASGGYNGGGYSYGLSGLQSYASGGGGGTDIRQNNTSFANKIIVAGGGGGGYYNNTAGGGHGGGLSGFTGENPPGWSYRGGGGGTQSSGGINGGWSYSQNGQLHQGGNNTGSGGSWNGCGGGGGYYGGGSGAALGAGGGGGSGYVATSLTNTQLIAGNATMPNPFGGTMVGKSGNGYARITQLYSVNITETAAVPCSGASNGALTAVVDGGSAPYTYAWSNGQSGVSISNLSGGTYTVTVTDQNSATVTGSYTLASRDIADINQNDTIVCAGSSISLSVDVQNNNTAAADFDGVNDYINLGDIVENIDSISFEGWVNLDGYPSSFWDFDAKDAISTVALNNQGKLHVNFGNGFSWLSGVNSVNTIPLNTWTHIAVTFDGGEIKLYINGQDEGTHVFNGIVGANSDNRGIATKFVSNNPTNLVNGQMDEWRAWNRVLSQEEILCKMNQQITSHPDLLYNLSFSEGSGTTTAVTNYGTKTLIGAVFTQDKPVVSSNTYLWSTGETCPEISPRVQNSTTYYVTVTDRGAACIDSLKAGIKTIQSTVLSHQSCPGVADGSYTINIPGGVRPYTITTNVSGNNLKTSTFNINDFALNSDASNPSGNTITLTPNVGSKNGSVWNKNRLDLSADFEVNAEVFLGNNDGGADGIAFMLQPLSTNQGSIGGGLGYGGISPSLAVEFDTYKNGSELTNDHLGLMKNGNTSNHTLFGLNPIDLGNIEDGNWRNFKVKWTAATTKLEVFFDGQKRFDLTQKIDSTVFNGNPYVYWGFTGATGGGFNLQQVRIGQYSVRDEALFVNDTARGLSPGTYITKIVDALGCILYDTTVIDSAVPPLFTFAQDTITSCGVDSVLVDAGAGWASYAWSNGATSQNATVTSTGTYFVTVTNNNGCSASDSVVVSVISENIAAASQTICIGDSLSINLSSTALNRLGTGADGDFALASGTQQIDIIKSAVTGSNAANQKNLSIQNASAFSEGDEVLIITMADGNSGLTTGNYELNVIAQKNGNQLQLETPLSHSYTASGTLKHQVIKVWNYRNVTINSGATLTCSSWNGSTGGILAFRASGKVINNGTITANERGYRGVSHTGTYRNQRGIQGEGIAGQGYTSSTSAIASSVLQVYTWNQANTNGGGGGSGRQDGSGGGGGGYGTAGSAGENHIGFNKNHGGLGGLAVGDKNMNKLIFGGAGGEGGSDEDGDYPGFGGNGGGIIFLVADSLENNGVINSNGQNGGNGRNSRGAGMGSGGGGAGGSIFISSNISVSGLILANGGNGGTNFSDGGNGGQGRVRVESPVNMINSTPSAYLTPFQKAFRNGSNSSRYNWSTGETTASINVSPQSTTTYYVTISNNIHSCVDSITVTVNNPSFTFAQDTITSCGVDSALMDAGAGWASYAWSNSATTQTTSVKTSGTYTVTVTDANGCTASDNVMVSFINGQIVQNDTNLCLGSSLNLSIKNAVSNNAADFTNGDFLRVANLNNFTNSNNITLGTWVKFTGSGVMVIASQSRSPSDANTQFRLLVVNGKLSFWDHNSGVGIHQVTGKGAVNDGQWHHIAFVKNNTVGKFYIDGSLDSTVTLYTKTYGSNDFVIGKEYRDNQYRFIGQMDDFQYWQASLTDAEVQAVYNRTPTQTSSLLLNYKFDNDNSSTIADATSNNNDAVNNSIGFISNSTNSYLWSTASTAPAINVTPTGTTTYYVTTTNGISSCVDSVTVTVNNPSFAFAQDTITSCGASSATVDAGAGWASYAWSNSATTQTTSITASGTYTVTVTDANGCTASDNVVVSVISLKLSSSSITACSGVTTNIGVSSLPVYRGLQLHYPMDGNAKDVSANNLNGEIIGNITGSNDRFSKTNGSLNFPNSTTLRTFIVNNPSFFNGTTDFTYSFWIKPETFTRYPMWFRNGQWGSGHNFGVRNNTLLMMNGITVGSGTVSFTPTLNSWNHMVIRRKGDTISQWSNGVFQGNYTTSKGNVFSPTKPLYIGSGDATSDTYFRGDMDDFAYYNSALTPTEIKALYSAPNPSLFSYSWSNGDTTSSINVSPLTTTKYYVTISDGISSCVDSVTVTVSNPTFAFAQDTITACGQDSVNVDAGAGWASYAWSNSVTTQTISVKTSGTYTVMVTDANGCTVSDSVVVSVIEGNTSQLDTVVICNGESVDISAVDNGVNGKTKALAFYNLNQVHDIPSGVYWYRAASDTFQIQVDGTTDGGGWVMVLNYNHLGGTNPSLNVFTDGLPLEGSSTLGVNESSSSTTWGHASNALFTKLNPEEVRFYGQTSNHSRVIHFKTKQANTLNYFKTGTGDMTGINNSSNYTLLSGHTAFLPNSTANYFTNESDLAMTNFPFWLGGTYHWGVKGSGSRWEVDDYPNNSNHNTLHRIWVRGGADNPVAAWKNYAINWSTGDTTSTITVSPTVTTPYYVTTSDGISSCIDTIVVTVSSPSFTFAQDTISVCGQDSVNVDAGAGWSSYGWSNSATTQTISVKTSGTYTVTVTDANGCTASDSVVVNISSPIVVSFAPTAPSGLTAVPSAILNNVPEATGYGVVYELDIPIAANYANNAINYAINNSNVANTNHDRVAYYMQLDGNWIWVSMDDFASGNLQSLGLPRGQTNNVIWDQVVSNMNIYTNKSGVTTGENIATGNIEMWSQCYGQNANSGIGGSSSVYDFDDEYNGGPNCHGSFQVHNYGANQTLFAYNRFPQNGTGELGIGNNSGSHPDWTFQQTANTYSTRKLYILVGNSNNSVTALDCNGDADGAITLNTSGGTAPLSYLWSNADTSASLTGLTAGVYTVTITDANSCTTTSSVTITEPAVLAASSVVNSNVSCNGGSDGSVTASAIGGTSPYTYSWNTGETAATETGLGAGTYTVTISDANSCTSTSSVTITEPTALVASSVVNSNVTCNSESDGSATASAIGGTSPYNYTWSNSATTVSITGVTAGTYTVTVSDANSCTSASSVTITQPTALSVSSVVNTNENCFGDSDGSATATATGGTAPYTYLWSTADTSVGISGVPAGTYTITVTDANACVAIDSVTILQTPLNYSCSSPIALTNWKQEGQTSNGSWSLSNSDFTVRQGTNSNPTFFVSDSNFFNTAVEGEFGVMTTGDDDMIGFVLGYNSPNAQTSNSQYDFILFDWKQTTQGLAPEGARLLKVKGNSSNISSVFWEASDAIVTTLATNSSIGGWADNTYYQFRAVYTASNIKIYINNALLFDVNGSFDPGRFGFYNYSQSDAVYRNFSVPFEAVINKTDVTCFGANDGVATVNSSSGFYRSIRWSTGDTTASVSNLSPGNYSVTVTNSGCCADSIGFTITEPVVLSSSTAVDANVSCNGLSDGGATASTTGGTAPYTYIWSNSDTTASISGVAAGTYTVTVSDANACTSTSSVTITEPAVLAASSVVNSNVSCNGGSNGSVTASAIGGTSPYTYSWNTGETAATETGLGAGTYTVTISDANSCTSTSSITITEPTALVASSVVNSNVSCNGLSDGGATASATGGTAPYTYSWSNSATTASITGVTAGTYTVTVSDANSCTSASSVTITQPAALAASSVVNSNISCNGLSDGSATASAIGGTSPYNYTWSNSSTTASITGLTAGTYTVTVSDANSCTSTSSVTITEPAVLAASTVVNSNISCSGLSDGSATASAIGGTSPYNYAWSNSATTASITGAAAGTYTVTVSDANACTSTSSVIITQPTTLVASASTIQNVTVFGLNDGSATVNVTGGTASYTYSWSNGGNSATINNLFSGTYSVTVTDQNGCTSVSQTTVNEPGSIILAMRLDSNVTCNGGMNGGAGVSVTGGVKPYTILWSNSLTDSTITGLSAGTYTVTVTDANGGTAVNDTTITEPAQLIGTASIVNNASCAGVNDGAAQVAVSGGTLPYSYVWSNSDTTAGVSSLFSGSYSVTITDGNNCTAEATVSVLNNDTVPPSLQLYDSVTVYLNASGTATLNVNDLDSASFDNCGIQSITLSDSIFGCALPQATFNGVTALNFDGTDDYVDLSGSLTQDTSHTIAMWIKTTATNSPFLFAWGGSGINNYGGLSLWGSRIRYYSGNGTPGVLSVSGSNNVNDGNWHHVAIARDNSGNVSLYVDGQLDGSGAISKYVSSVTNVSLGAAFANNIYQGQYAGNIDDLNYWSRALTASEIQELICKNTKGTDLIAAFTFSEAAGNTVSFNQQSGIINGTLMNMDAVSSWVPFGSPVLTNCTAENKSTITVTDISGNKDSATVSVNVVDTIKPTILTQPLTVYLDASGLATITANDIDNGTIDNCQLDSIFINSTIFDCSDVGSNTITFTATDVSGNTSISTEIVTVVDTIKPLLSTRPLTVYLDANGLATITANDLNNGTTDNCQVASLAIDSTTFDHTELGPNNVWFTAVDVNNNVDSMMVIVTVLDTTVPVIAAQPRTIYLDVNGQASITAADLDNGTADNCQLASIAIDSSNFDCTEIGTNNVQFTAVDASGNRDSATAVVTVVDSTAPAIITQPLTVYLDANGQASITAADLDNGTSDNCQVASIAIDSSSFDCTEVGANTVTFTATDVNSNVSTANVTVTVVDSILPVIATQPVTVYLDANGQASITAADLDNGTTDNCQIASIAIDSSSFDCTEVGANTVTFTATDANSNVSTANVTVTVLDTVSPIISTQPITVYLDANGQASITASDLDNGTTDNCQLASIAIDSTTFDVTELGANNVLFTAIDINGNRDSSIVVVTVSDTLSPTITNCPMNITISTALNSCDAVVNWVAPTAIDNAQLDSLISTHVIGSTFPLGTTTVTYVAYDQSLNTDTCSFTITVIDSVAPVIVNAPTAITVSNDPGQCNSIVSWTLPTATDNCQLDSIVGSQVPGAVFSVGVTTVQYIAYDAAMNTDTIEFTVTVNDTELPTINCIADTTICDGVFNYSAPIVADNCGILSVVRTSGLASGSIFPIGSTVVTHVVTDINGNIDSCSFTVTRDELPTVATAGADLNVCIDTVTLSGNTPNVGAGIWTSLTSGTTILSANDPSSEVVLQRGANTLVWTISNGVCASSSDTITITYDSDPTLADAGADQIICEERGTIMEANTPLVGNGFWSITRGSGTPDDITDPKATVTGLADGENVLVWTIENGTCEASIDSVVVKGSDNPVITMIGDTTIFEEDGAQLYVNTDIPATSYDWNPPFSLDNRSVQTPYARPDENTVYTVRVTTADDCFTEGSVTITVINGLKIPGAFTPNGDGQNDTWEIKNLEQFDNHSIVVYDGYGSEVFSSSNTYTPWDGTYDGRALSVGSYYYIINYTVDGQSTTQSGIISILR
jgi:gliding motility-associated-like protein